MNNINACCETNLFHIRWCMLLSLPVDSDIRVDIDELSCHFGCHDFLAKLCTIVENHTYLIDWLHYTQCQNAAAKHNKTWILWIIRREYWKTSGQISWWKILVSEVVMFLYRLFFISFHQPVHHLPSLYIIVHVDSTKINYRPRAAKCNKYV